MKAIGLILIVVGVLSLTYQGFTYTTHKKVLDVGPIQATKEEHHSVPLPPILGEKTTFCPGSRAAWVITSHRMKGSLAPSALEQMLALVAGTDLRVRPSQASNPN